MMTLDLHRPILRQGQISTLMLLYETGKTMDFSETIVVFDVKVERSSEYQRWRSFIDLGPRSPRFNILKLLFLRNGYVYEAKFHVEPPLDGE